MENNKRKSRAGKNRDIYFLHISSVLAIVSEPFILLPKKIKNILNFKDEINWTWEGLKKKDFLINENHKINEPELLFNRIKDLKFKYKLTNYTKKIKISPRILRHLSLL